MDLNDGQIEQLATEIRDYQITHGSLLKLVRFEEPTTVPARPVSVSLYPTAFPGQLFDRALTLQLSYNELYIRASNDHRWLEGVLEGLFDHDEFVDALWQICKRVPKELQDDNIVCGIFRSDYMLHLDPVELKQVEMNTFSVAGACHAERVAKMHRHVQNVLGAKPEGALPESHNTSSLVDTLVMAHQHYRPSTQKKLCVLMIVQGKNFNIADERPIEYGLVDQGIPCYRCDWYDVLDRTSLDSQLTLLYTHPWGGEASEVSVVYYRAGYQAVEYVGQGAGIRLHLERSRAIKCPDVLTHLMTLKIVQAALTASGAVDHFLSPEQASAVRATFVPMQPLDTSPSGLQTRQNIMQPNIARRYVLKPNLEGGGHNVYQEDIPKFLSTIPQNEWGNYSAMRMIEPPETHGLLETPEQRYYGPVISELGVLGTCLWRRHHDSVEILSNKTAGWTFKTKPASVQEMNVVKGHGCFDCPLLI